MQQLDEEIDRILANSPYSMAPSEKEPILLELLKEELDRGSRIHAGYKNYLEHCPVDYRCADRVSDLALYSCGHSESQSSALVYKSRRSQENPDFECDDLANAQPGCA